MTSFIADIDRGKSGSPDRVDALVWALTDLVFAAMASEGIYEVYRQLSNQAHTSQPNDGCTSMRKEHDR